MTANFYHYTIAGWLAIISAVLLIPEIGLAVLGEYLSPDFSLLVLPVHIINTFIGLFLLFMLKKLLNEVFNFHKVNTLIVILIFANILFSAIGIVAYSFNILNIDRGLTTLVSIVTLALFVPYSILRIVFGVLILKMQDDLFGFLKPFAYVTIASGVFGASVIGAPIGLLCAIAALIIEGMIFLRANRELEIL